MVALLAPCSTTGRHAFATPGLATCRLPAATVWRRQRLPRVGAQPEGGSGPPAVDEEARLEALEAAVRAKKGMKASTQQRQRTSRGMDDPNEVEWRKGSLLPEKWEEMDTSQRMSQLYMGKFGFQYWASQAAWYSCIGLGVLWVAFRFVGPAIGLYRLAGDVEPPAF